MNIRSWFCKHNFETYSFLPLGTFREDSGGRVMDLPVYANYKKFTEGQKCTKCGELRVITTRYLSANHQSSVLR